MRIACPDCDAAYDVPPERLSPGRMVRCARCGHAWRPIPAHAAAPLPEAAPDATPNATPDLSPGPAPTPEPAAPSPQPPLVPIAPLLRDPPPERRPSSAPLRLAWLFTILLLAGAAYAAVRYQAELVAAWPPSARAYAAFGLTHATH